MATATAPVTSFIDSSRLSARSVDAIDPRFS